MKFIKIILISLLLVSVTVAQTAWDIKWGTDLNSNMPSNTLKQWAEGVEGRLGGVSNLGTGNIFYVDSGVTTEGDGTSWTNARNTLDEAVGLCTDYNGDVIYVAQGHAEDWSAADSVDLDVIGVTIIGCGTGTNRPTFTYDNTAAEFVLGAADCYVYNLAFLPSVAQVVHAIEVEADADGSVIDSCWFMDGETAATDEFKDTIQWTAASDNITVINCVFESYSSTATDVANAGCDLSAGVVKDTKIINNYFYGHYSDAPIFSDDIDLRSIIAGNRITNIATGQYAIEFSTTATGAIISNYCATDTAGTVIDPGSMETANNMEVDYGAAEDADAGPAWALAKTRPANNYPANVENDSLLAMMMVMDNTGVATISDYDNDTMSQEALNVDLDAILALIKNGTLDKLTTPASTYSILDILGTDGVTATGAVAGSILGAIGTNETAANTPFSSSTVQSDADGSVLERLEYVQAAIAALTGVGLRGTCATNADTSTIISTELTGFGDDYFNTNWCAIVILDYSGAGTAPEGEVRDITNYVSSTGTFTVDAAFTAAITENDEVYIRRYEEMAFNDVTMLGGSVNIWYCDDGGSGGDGKTWASAKTTLKATEALASAGDIIFVGANHNENIVAADAVTLNVAGLKVIGMGTGDSRPRFDMDDDGTMITIDNAGILFKNFRIMPGVTDCDIALRVEDAALGCTIEDVSIIDGEVAGTDEFVDVISVDTLASKLTVRNCTYISSGNGCGTFVNLDEATIADATIEGCVVYAPMAEAAVWGGAAVPTNVLIKDNIIANGSTGQLCIEFQGAATGHIIGNKLYSDAYATILDPGSCYCLDNWAVDAIDQAAIPIPLSVLSDDVTEDDDGSDLERLEYLQNKVEDILAGIRMAGGSVGDVYYVDDGGSGGAATTWATAETTLDAAVADCTANVGDIIFVAPGHDEDLGAAQVTCDVAGITIIGIGEGAEQPQIVFNDAASSIDVTAAGVTIKNLNLHSSTAASAIGVDVDAGDFRMEDCLFTDTGDNEFAICIDLGATAENAVIKNCKALSTTGTTGATSCIAVTGGVIDRLVVEGCQIIGDFDNAGIYSDQINTNALIKGNSITNLETGDHAIELSAAMTGDLVDNMLYADTYGAVLDPGSMRCYGNKQCVGADTGAEDIPLIAGKSYARKMLSGDLNASDNLFSVTGSPIIVTSFLGKCTVECGGATTLKIFCDADDTFDYDLSTSVDVDTVDAGGLIIFTAAAGESVLTVQAVGSSGSMGVPIQWWVEEGMLESTVDAGGSTGDMEWYMIFTPVENGCEVIPQ